MEVQGFSVECENAGFGCDSECAIRRLRKDRSLGELKYESLAGALTNFYIMSKRSGICSTVTVVVHDTDANRYPGSCRFTAAAEGPDEEEVLKYITHTVNEKHGDRISGLLSRYLKK